MTKTEEMQILTANVKQLAAHLGETAELEETLLKKGTTMHKDTYHLRLLLQETGNTHSKLANFLNGDKAKETDTTELEAHAKEIERHLWRCRKLIRHYNKKENDQ